MPYTTLEDYNVTEPYHIMTYVASIVPAFVPLMLFTIFMMVLSVSYFAAGSFSGRRDFLGSFAVSSWFVSIIAIIMSLIPNFISITTLTTTIVISVISTVFLIFRE